MQRLIRGRARLVLAIVLGPGIAFYGTVLGAPRSDGAEGAFSAAHAPGGALYWGGAYGDGIGRVDLSRRNTAQTLLSHHPPSDIEVRGRHVYWIANEAGSPIGRATVTRRGSTARFTDVRPRFILPGLTRAQSADQIAIDASHIYWTVSSSAKGAIGRASLDGTHVNRAFLRVAGKFSPQALAVAGGHIYWTDYSLSSDTSSIGRAKLDGTARQPRLISGLRLNPDPSLAANARYLFWTGNAGIGRARLDGSAAEENLVDAPSPVGLAVDGSYIYWGGYGSGRTRGRWLSRAALDGSAIDRRFVDTRGIADGVQSVAIGRG